MTPGITPTIITGYVRVAGKTRTVNKVAHSDQQLRLRNEILWELESTEWDMAVMPHYGMVPDFTPRYHRLSHLIREYLDNEREELGAQQWEEAQRQRNKQREAKGAQTNIEGA